MFTFIHCADLHLDSPLRGLSKREDAPVDEIRLATRRALTNLVNLCIEKSVDFLVIAGDVYDGDWQDYSTGLFFNREMARLRKHNIPVYLIRGNHDAASNITKQLQLPDNVYEFSVDHPETVTIEELKVALHGQGYKERDIWTNLAITYPEPRAGYFNIGILHTSLEGKEGHEKYAPARLDELIQKGYDYWALGHIHKREVIHEKPYIVFPGNIQGRHVRETGNKGCTLVKVDGKNVTLEHRDLDVLRWYVCTVDVTDVDSDQEMVALVEKQISDIVSINPGYPLALRVELIGNTILHHSFLEEPERYRNEIVNAANMTSNQVWIEKVKFLTELPYEMVDAEDRKDALSLLVKSIDSAKEDEEFLNEFLTHVKYIQHRFGNYLKRDEATQIEDEKDVAALMKEGRDLLLGLLTKGGKLD